MAQALAFLLAGFETAASTMSFALYELALHPEIQRSVRAEILQVLNKHNGKLTYDAMQDMSYLDRVLSGEERNEVKQHFVKNAPGLDEENSKVASCTYV